MNVLWFGRLVHVVVQYAALFLIALLVIRLIFPPSRFRYGTGSLVYRIGRWTDFIVLPIQSVLPPGTSLAVGGILAIFVVILVAYFALSLFDQLLFGVVGFFQSLSQGAVIAAIGYLLSAAVSLFITLLVIRIVFSWVRIGYYSGGRVTRFVYDTTEPLLSIFRGIVPTFGGFDLSPILLFFLLYLLKGAIHTLLIGG